MPLWARVLVLVVFLVLTTAAATLVHLSVMEGAVRLEWRPLVEAANFAMQTITTVGYGNWVPPKVEKAAHENDDKAQDKILRMKGFSIFFMFAGGALFAAAVGMVTNWLSRPQTSPPIYNTKPKTIPAKNASSLLVRNSSIVGLGLSHPSYQKQMLLHPKYLTGGQPRYPAPRDQTGGCCHHCVPRPGRERLPRDRQRLQAKGTYKLIGLCT